jgi:cation diffusion facilitator CzcD-associated flavoprotein CzcO
VTTLTSPVAIIGAGPYGLATAAYLRGAGIEPLVLGEVMGAWKRMPRGMLLRSFRESTNIGDPESRLTIDRFAEERGRPVSTPVPISDFVGYGRWFQSLAVPEVDGRFAESIERDRNGFRVSLDDGTELTARRVVVAAGIEAFAHLPSELAELDSSLFSHSSLHSDLGVFEGRRLLIVGAGQSALEWGTLAHEAGAEVEIVCRSPLRFLRGERLHDRAGALRALLYPRWGVGPPGLNLIMGRPETFRHLPRRLAVPLAERAIRPAGAAWLRPRLTPVVVTSGTTVQSVRQAGRQVTVALDDGSERQVDHVIAATGYRVDISRYPFLSQDLLSAVQRLDGFPLLTSSYESSLSGLHFVGAPAAGVMGPGMRFVSHSGQAAAAVARQIARTG